MGNFERFDYAQWERECPPLGEPPPEEGEDESAPRPVPHAGDDPLPTHLLDCPYCGGTDTFADLAEYPTGVVAPDGCEEYYACEVAVCPACGRSSEL